MRLPYTASVPLRGDINVTPMLDVLLVLLVVFMLVERVRSILPIHLPRLERSAAADPVAAHIVLQLREDGSYAINGQPSPFDLLGRRLRELYLDRPVKLLFVQSAPTRAYGDVIDAVDVARGAGVQVVGFAPYSATR
jgi:biopolymer transport protein ExbD